MIKQLLPAAALLGRVVIAAAVVVAPSSLFILFPAWSWGEGEAPKTNVPKIGYKKPEDPPPSGTLRCDYDAQTRSLMDRPRVNGNINDLFVKLQALNNAIRVQAQDSYSIFSPADEALTEPWRYREAKELKDAARQDMLLLEGTLERLIRRVVEIRNEACGYCRYVSEHKIAINLRVTPEGAAKVAPEPDLLRYISMEQLQAYADLWPEADVLQKSIDAKCKVYGRIRAGDPICRNEPFKAVEKKDDDRGITAAMIESEQIALDKLIKPIFFGKKNCEYPAEGCQGSEVIAPPLLWRQPLPPGTATIRKLQA